MKKTSTARLATIPEPELGTLYRPVKKPVALRIDADVLAWLKQQGPGYQGRINAILRREMLTKPHG